MPVKDSWVPSPIIADDSLDVVTEHWVYTPTGADPIGTLKVGYLVSANAGLTALAPFINTGGAPANPAGQWLGIVALLPEPEIEGRPAGPHSVTVFVHGAFAFEHVKYANDYRAIPADRVLNPATILRLREIGLYLRRTVPYGPFAP